ncbi:polysaccharide pyruvyl transferase family protein [Pseudomonas fragi]|uniref:polysaccharide pyruvyl transferase family protein n=1 Tax=Pseudomonas TaxID=286 RepID=UPI001473E013|nr:hypothetical protein [Pseudomonas fragi]MBM1204898.1 hypothetical protein [Pseudomonas fragi]NMY57978.1 hypothetical protein [Pseudomonas sp. WS 5051]
MNPKISITNHTGSRNRGCEALVASKIAGIRNLVPNASFVIHSNDPMYDKWRFEGVADTVLSYLTKTPNHPNSLAINKLAYKTLALIEKIAPKKTQGISINSIGELKSSDLVICSGGDIFTSDYGNLRKHLSYPIASTQKTYLCSQSIGPFKKSDETYFLKAVERVSAISVRESASFEYLKSKDIQTDLHLVADVAFTLPTLDRKIAEQYILDRFGITAAKPIVAISVSQGIIKYLSLNKEDYYTAFAKFVDFLTEQGKQVILIPHVIETNPGNNDIIACDSVLNRTVSKGSVKVIYGEPSATELKGIIGLSECLIGTRTHATIASMSQRVPTVSIAYSRKAYGIMNDIYGESQAKNLTIDAKDLTFDSLVRSYETSLESTINTVTLDNIKLLSHQNFEIAKKLLSI